MNVLLSKYGLPDKPDELHKLPRPGDNPAFRHILEEIAERDEEARTLKRWIRGFI